MRHAVHVRLWHSCLSLKCLGFSLGAASSCGLHAILSLGVAFAVIWCFSFSFVVKHAKA